jgi:molybdate-binding protein
MGMVQAEWFDHFELSAIKDLVTDEIKNISRCQSSYGTREDTDERLEMLRGILTKIGDR